MFPVLSSLIPFYLVKLLNGSIKRERKSTARPPWQRLDPFAGTATTCAVAQRLGRRAVGLDMKEEHLELAVKRLTRVRLPDHFARNSGGTPAPTRAMLASAKQKE